MMSLILKRSSSLLTSKRALTAALTSVESILQGHLTAKSSAVISRNDGVIKSVFSAGTREFHAKSRPLDFKSSVAWQCAQSAVHDHAAYDVGNEDEGLEISKLGVSQDIVSALAGKGITKLFPIQRAVLEPAMQGRDMIGRARTGTGKTLAFGIPILDKIIKFNEKHGKGRNPLCLVLAPTRELAKQVEKEFHESAPSLGTICVYGGTPIHSQMGDLHHGVDVVVGTPGRVIDLIKRNALNLSEVQFVVLDEADHMLSVNFAEDVEVILDRLPQDRQSMMFSATMPPSIISLTHKYLKNPLTVDLVGDSDQKLADGISLYSIATSMYEKSSIIGKLITEHAKGGKCIVFTEMKRDADRLASSLGCRSFNCEPLHGDISQSQRERTLSAFRNGSFNILIATDVAARGLDVPNVDLIIHYELPKTSDIFVHRTGRTGRAGKKGSAIVMYTDQQYRQVKGIEQDVGCRFTELPRIAVEGGGDMFNVMGMRDRGYGDTGFGRSSPGGSGFGRSGGNMFSVMSGRSGYGSMKDPGYGDTGFGRSGPGGSGFGRSGGDMFNDMGGRSGFGSMRDLGYGDTGFGHSNRPGGSGFGQSGGYRSPGFSNSSGYNSSYSGQGGGVGGPSSGGFGSNANQSGNFRSDHSSGNGDSGSGSPGFGHSSGYNSPYSGQGGGFGGPTSGGFGSNAKQSGNLDRSSGFGDSGSGSPGFGHSSGYNSSYSGQGGGFGGPSSGGFGSNANQSGNLDCSGGNGVSGSGIPGFGHSSGYNSSYSCQGGGFGVPSSGGFRSNANQSGNLDRSSGNGDSGSGSPGFGHSSGYNSSYSGQGGGFGGPSSGGFGSYANQSGNLDLSSGFGDSGSRSPGFGHSSGYNSSNSGQGGGFGGPSSGGFGSNANQSGNLDRSRGNGDSGSGSPGFGHSSGYNSSYSGQGGGIGGPSSGGFGSNANQFGNLDRSSGNGDSGSGSLEFGLASGYNSSYSGQGGGIGGPSSGGFGSNANQSGNFRADHSSGFGDSGSGQSGRSGDLVVSNSSQSSGGLLEFLTFQEPGSEDNKDIFEF